MAAVIPAVLPIPIQICPPMPCHGFEPFDQHQWVRTKHGPVTHAQRDAEGNETSASNLAFEDCTRISTVTHVVQRKRRLETPEWALDDKLLRKVLTGFMLRKALVYVAVPDDLLKQKKLIALAQARLDARIPKIAAQLDEVLRRSAEAQGPERERLIVTVRQLDSEIYLIRRGVALVAAIVVSYYRRGLDSVETARELKVPTSTYVRQLLHRLSLTWDNLDFVQKVNGPVSQETLEVIRQMRHDGLSTYRIADACSVQGLRTIKGGRLTQSAISKICVAHRLPKKKAHAVAQAAKQVNYSRVATHV
jgi:hypothetical protein